MMIDIYSSILEDCLFGRVHPVFFTVFDAGVIAVMDYCCCCCDKTISPHRHT